MSEKQERRVEQNERDYQAKVDKPLRKPPMGGSNVKPPPNQDKEKK
jgi:cysteine desulfurase